MMRAMKPEPKVFTKDRPCSKFELWTCFYGSKGFRTVQVDEAHAVIGLNVPRVMEREGRLEKVEQKQQEFYRLTEDGEEWLLKGFRNYLINHPSAWHLVEHVPKEWKRPENARAPSRVPRIR